MVQLPTVLLVVVVSVPVLISACFVQYHAGSGTSFLVKLLTTISFALGCGAVVLLPIDLAITTTVENENDAETMNEDEIVPDGPNDTYSAWMAIFWSTFALAWLILPVVRESVVSGEFIVWNRFRDGCKGTLKSYLIFFVATVPVYWFLAARQQSWNIGPFLMALANTYGLLGVSLLLGYGLIAIPRELWRKASPQLELRRTQILASMADDALSEAVWQLQDCESSIDKAAAQVGNALAHTKTPLDAYYATCLDQLLTRRKETANLDSYLQQRRAMAPAHEGEELQSSATELPTLNQLVCLNARLKTVQLDLLHAQQRWKELVARHERYSQIVEGGEVARPLAAATAPLNQPGMLYLVRARIRCVGRSMLCLCRTWWFRGFAYRTLAVLTAILSLGVLISEATLAAPTNLSPFAWMLKAIGGSDDGEKGVLFQVMTLIPLVYVSVCVYSSLFKFTLFGRYRLSGRRQSGGAALVMNAQFLVRLQFPLAYNFLYLIKYDTSSTDCAFSHVMKPISLVPLLGTSFSIYTPLLIIALCIFTLFNGYARLLALLGLDHEDAVLFGNQEALDEKIKEGVAVLRRYSERPAVEQAPTSGASLKTGLVV